LDYLKGLDSELEIQIAIWCINNCQVIEKLNNYNLHIVFYLDLISNPKEELGKILEIYGFENHAERLTKIKYQNVSSSSSKKGFQSPKIQICKNFDKLNNQEKHKIQRIFNHFDFKLYTAFSPYPDKLVLKVN
jgi:hypothetical protein